MTEFRPPALEDPGFGPDQYRYVEAPACMATCPVPSDIQRECQMPSQLVCDLPDGHDGNHLNVWDRKAGHGIEWSNQ